MCGIVVGGGEGEGEGKGGEAYINTYSVTERGKESQKRGEKM